MSELGKHGLTGSHGFIAPGVHVCANYAANKGNVFVREDDPETGSYGMSWKRVPVAEANPADIITCFCCEKPAVTVGPFFPLYSSDCACEEHHKLTETEREEIVWRKQHPKPELTLEQFNALSDDALDELIATEVLMLYRMGDNQIWWAGCDGDPMDFTCTRKTEVREYESSRPLREPFSPTRDEKSMKLVRQWLKIEGAGRELCKTALVNKQILTP